MKVFVPCDSSAVAVGADEVAAALAPHAEVVRTGSRGAFALEPLVEVEQPDGGRLAYGPVDAATALAVLDASHPAALGPPHEIRWLARQHRFVTRRLGVVDPARAEDHERHGGLAGLRRARSMEPRDVVAEVAASGLRGRGGAGFPAGVKWQTVLDAAAGGGPTFVCGNADEGDSGTFVDRLLMEGDPFLLLEGMAIAAHAVGASEGYVYIRSEYPESIAAVRTAIEAASWLAPFQIEVRSGAGSYICGEETAMLESLEGKRGVVRAKPPLPAIEGLFGRPTVVNNVLTLAAVPRILAEGPDSHAALGVGRSRGTQAFQLAGNVRDGGLVEMPFGTTLRELVEGFGGGTRSGRPIRAVQVGGPLGAYLPADALDVPTGYEELAEAGGLLGHGGVVVFDDTVDLAQQARFAMEFCAAESCGKCTPCRIGAVRGVEVLDRIIAAEDRDANLVLLDDLCEVMEKASLCAMGGLTPNPVRSALRFFAEDFA